MKQGVVPNLTAEVLAEVLAEVTTEVTAKVAVEALIEVAIEVLIILFNWGVGNLIYYYIVVQAGLGFNIDTSTALYLTVTER